MSWAGLFVFILFLSQALLAQSSCRYDSKDYDSPGFGIPYRSGFAVKARFGCVYRCACENGTQWKVTHVLQESHFDLNVFSKKTGGPHAAKWFICPESVDVNSWKAVRDEIGHVLYYTVDSNYKEFPVEKLLSSPQIQQWKKETCGED